MTKLAPIRYCHSLNCGRGSMVELELPQAYNAGSIPVARSRPDRASSLLDGARFAFQRG